MEGSSTRAIARAQRPATRSGDSSDSSSDEPQQVERDAVEITLLCNDLDDQRLQLVESAIEHVRELFFRSFDEIRWLIAVREEATVRRRSLVDGLERAVSYRDRHRQDFVIVVADSTFLDSDDQEVLCASSKSAGVAFLSLDPLQGKSLSRPGAAVAVSELLELLLIRLIGGEPSLAEAVADFKHFAESSESEPKTVRSFAKLTIEEIREELLGYLRDVADLRLEEHRRSYRDWGFIVQAMVLNRAAILENVRAARPWTVPLRVRGLTTAALSAALLLAMTAEVWDLAFQQSGAVVVGLALGVIGAMSVWLWHSQVMQIPGSGKTEQVITTKVSLGAIVFLGIVVTYSLLFATNLGLSYLLFSDALLNNWATASPKPPSLSDRIIHAGLLASVSLAIGSLGASLGGVERLRSIVYVDERVR